MTRRLILILLLLVQGTAVAQIYKWVDENGQVHYGERPPDELAVPMNVPSTGQQPSGQVSDQERQDRQRRLLRSFEEERQVKQASQQKRQQHEAKRAKNCTRAKDQLASYLRSRYLYEYDDKGEKVILSDEERKQEEIKARQFVKQWCEE